MEIEPTQTVNVDTALGIEATGKDSWKSRFWTTFWKPYWIASPTWGLASILKSRDDKVQRATVKLLTIGEVLCGVILLVVSFTIYTTRALGGAPYSPDCLHPMNGQDLCEAP